MIEFSAAQLEMLLRNASPSLRGHDHRPVVKLVLPGTGCAWLMTDLRIKDGVSFGYGLADHGNFQPRLSTFCLRELGQMRDHLGLHRVQTDRDFEAMAHLSDYAIAAGKHGAIVEVLRA